jgi:hypothetical protein
MEFYYLNETDVIREGDQEECTCGCKYWFDITGYAIGLRKEEVSSKRVKIRRLIRQTSKGNTL